METAIVFGLGFLLAVVTLVFQFNAKRFDFVEEYEKDKRAYEEACKGLYIALNGNRPFSPDLHEYLSRYLLTKLRIEGVSSWSSWGKSIRLFYRLRTVAVWYSVCLLVIFSVYLAILSFVKTTSGVLVINTLTVAFPIIIVGILIYWGICISRCITVLAKRKVEEMYSPTVEWLRDNRVVPDYGLVLLIKLLSENKPREIV
ncbi:MAG: hypothetical protein IH859_08720 [Chloroflexi bacterium]|nr:hypothetical protein [Chloroflexota bacterium]